MSRLAVGMSTDKAALEELSVAELKLHLRDFNEKTSGVKKDLVDRLYEAMKSSVLPEEPIRESKRLKGLEPDGSYPSQHYKGFWKSIGIIAALAALYSAVSVTLLTTLGTTTVEERREVSQAFRELIWPEPKRVVTAKVPEEGVSSMGGGLPISETGVDEKRVYTQSLVARSLRLKHVLSSFARNHFWWVVGLMSAVYLFFQTFFVLTFWLPGVATTLTIIAGGLLGWWKGVVWGCTMSTVGPCLAYGLYACVGQPVVEWLCWKYGMMDKFDHLKRAVQHSHDRPFFLVLFGRLLPIFPNFLVSAASPIIGIDFLSFVLGTFVGLIPNSVALISTGVGVDEALKRGENEEDVSFRPPPWSFALMALIAAAVPLIYWAKHRVEEKLHIKPTKNA